MTAYRTVHGIVFARGKVDGRKVAFVSARTTYGHEADSALFFARMNNPKQMRNGPKSFRAATKVMNFGFNWAYIDSKHIAYQLTGWYPRRARGSSPDFPILGTGQFDWKGFDPKRYEADWLPQSRLPHAVDQRYLVSWNNKQAPGWAAADDIWEYSDLHRSQMISEKVAAGTRGGRKMTLAELVQAMEGPATQDLRGYRVLPLLVRVIGTPKSADLRNALAALRAWHQAGSHRRDLNGNGAYEHNARRAADGRLVAAAGQGGVRADPGQDRFRAGRADGPARRPHAARARRPRLLRRLVGPGLEGPADRCSASGSRAGAAPTAAAVRWPDAAPPCTASLGKALKVTPQQLYGYGDCESDPQPACFDRNNSIVASGLSIEPQPFQNRPTFQQTVSVPRDLP